MFLMLGVCLGETIAIGDKASELEDVDNEQAGALRDPFNPLLQQVDIPLYSLQSSPGKKTIFNDLIQIKVLALGENERGQRTAFIKLPTNETIMVKEGEWFNIQGADFRIIPVSIKEIMDARLVVLIDQQSKFILR